MKKLIRIDRPATIKDCGSRKKGGCNWAGATTMIKSVKVAA
ncbi:MAG: hypothetical protein V4608_10975 [Bacteroidota bacterium]